MRKIFKNIIWFPVILSLLATYVLGKEVFYIVCLGCLVALIALKRFKMPIPRIAGIGFLAFYAAYAFAEGILYQYPLRDIIRDMFYITEPIIVLVLGYVSYTCIRNKKSIVYTVCVFSLVTAVGNVILALLTGGAGFGDLRAALSRSIELISYGFILFFLDHFYHQNDFPTKVSDCAAIFLGANILFCMSRAIFVAAILSFLAVLAYMFAYLKMSSSRKFWRILLSTLGVLVGIIAVGLLVLPQQAIDEFVGKMLKSVTEISTNINFATTSDIVESWRGYEVAQAQMMFREGNLFQQLFGYGAGKQIDVPVLATLYSNGRYGMTSPLLHNGYYTILIKGGLAGVASYILFFGSILWDGIKNRRTCYETLVHIYMCVYMLVASYVIRGLMGQGTDFWWTFIIGYIFAELHYRKEGKWESAL